MFRKIKDIIKKSETPFTEWLFVKYYEKRERQNIHRNQISCHIDSDELNEYHKKWRKIVKYQTPYSFKLYSHFIDNQKTSIVSQVVAFKVEAILNPKRYDGYLSDKNNFTKLLPSAPFPKTLLRKINNVFYDSDYNYIPDDILSDYIDNIIQTCQEIIVKDSIESDSGRGVRLLKLGDNLSSARVSSFKDELITLLSDKKSKNLILQECMHQHAFLSQFNPTSVNTIRVATYRSVKNNEVNILSTVIRMGAPGKYIDNLHGGGHMVRVHEDGSLADHCIDQYGTRFESHNGIRTEGLVLPYYDDIKKLVKELSAKLTNIRLIQWDIMIDSDGCPRVIEFNCSGFSMWIAQMTGTPAFGSFTDEIIDYCEHILNKDIQTS